MPEAFATAPNSASCAGIWPESTGTELSWSLSCTSGSLGSQVCIRHGDPVSRVFAELTR